MKGSVKNMDGLIAIEIVPRKELENFLNVKVGEI
jgi:hypothetical protein